MKISTGAQKLYVVEGDRVLIASPCSVGMAGHETPRGSFRAYNKIAHKRSGSYGFSIEGSHIRGCKASQARGRYVGYPMPYWIEFSPAYGIHCGYIKPYPCTHGCVRLPKRVAPKVFALVPTGTPILVATSHAEDATVGKSLPRFDDTTLPDPPATRIVSQSIFEDHAYPGKMFVD
ncbi:MAG: L,D-transpeptidase [Verrucomicrobiales bacterium]